jgi:hypothetical protein
MLDATPKRYYTYISQTDKQTDRIDKTARIEQLRDRR